MGRKFKNIIVIMMLMIIVSVSAMGCGSAKKDTAMSESKASMEMPAANSGFNISTNYGKDEAKTKSDNKANVAKGVNNSEDILEGSLQSQGKIIKNGIIQMETLNFDEAVENILSKTNNMGGYVQSSNTSGRRIEVKSYEESRSGEFILRIPKTKFDSFISDIGNLGSITNQQISTEDVTAAYFDTQAHLKSLNIQEERLLELLKKTGELKDIIALEKELSNVIYEIESLTGSLKKWDNLIDFCTLNINLREVHKIKENPISFGEKIVNGFTNSVKSLIDFGKEFIVVISICLPYIVILAIVLFIARYIFIHRKRS